MARAFLGLGSNLGDRLAFLRDAVASMPDAKRRAYAAHENAYENFPFFAVAVITATTLGAGVVHEDRHQGRRPVAVLAHPAPYHSSIWSDRGCAGLCRAAVRGSCGSAGR